MLTLFITLALGQDPSALQIFDYTKVERQAVDDAEMPKFVTLADPADLRQDETVLIWDEDEFIRPIKPISRTTRAVGGETVHFLIVALENGERAQIEINKKVGIMPKASQDEVKIVEAILQQEPQRIEDIKSLKDTAAYAPLPMLAAMIRDARGALDSSDKVKGSDRKVFDAMVNRAIIEIAAATGDKRRTVFDRLSAAFSYKGQPDDHNAAKFAAPGE